MLNISPLFFSSDDEITLLTNIELLQPVKDGLAASKQLIRKHLRENLPRVIEADTEIPEAIQPRFFTQGSWAYNTLNAPAQEPQQCDIDDGVYLPMSFVQEARQPSVASKSFFRAVEKTLQPLADKHGWTVDSGKLTCVRVILSPTAHEDVPLYAIPDEEFARLAEAHKAFASLGERFLGDTGAPDAWEALDDTSVLLAHREDNWVRSDPRPIKEWFLKSVKVHTEQYRRVVRYLKAYRDWTWPTGGPASILLMVAAEACFEHRRGRDDLALLEVAKKLPDVLRDGVSNPCDEDESLTKRLGEDGVEEACEKIEVLGRFLQAAMDADDEVQACTIMQQMFGQRFPMAPQRIKRVTVDETVSAAPALIVASPIVGRSKAG